jgi:hypothetical protein
VTLGKPWDNGLWCNVISSYLLAEPLQIPAWVHETPRQQMVSTFCKTSTCKTHLSLAPLYDVRKRVETSTHLLASSMQTGRKRGNAEYVILASKSPMCRLNLTSQVHRKKGSPAATQEPLKSCAGANSNARPDFQWEVMEELVALENEAIILNEYNFDVVRSALGNSCVVRQLFAYHAASSMYSSYHQFRQYRRLKL